MAPLRLTRTTLKNMTVDKFFQLSHADRERVEDLFPNRPKAALGSKPSGIVKPTKNAKRARAVALVTAATEAVFALIDASSTPIDNSAAGSGTSGSGTSGSGSTSSGGDGATDLMKRNGIDLSSKSQVIPKPVSIGKIGKKFPKTKFTVPKGINNPNTRCYRNALLQCLFHTPEFYHLMGNVHKDCPLSAEECITCALQRMMHHYWNGNRNTVNDDGDILDLALKRKISDVAIQNDLQSDSYDLLLHFIRYIEWDAFGTDPFTPGFVSPRFDDTDPHSFTISSLFDVRYDVYWTCQACGKEMPCRQESASGFDMNVIHEIAIGDSLEGYIDDPRMSPFVDLNDSKCDSDICQAKQLNKGYKLPQQTKVKRITHAPEILIIRLNRITAEWVPRPPKINKKTGESIPQGDFNSTKHDHKITYSDTLDLTKYSGLMDDDITYQLRGVVTHIGETIEDGHYTAGVSCRGNKGRCSEISDRSVQTSGTSKDFLLRPSEGTAYILIYSKKDNS